MSQENVEIVLGLYPGPDVDYVPLFRDDSLWAEFAEALAPATGAALECVWYQLGGPRRYAGLDGLRAWMLDWTAPWVAYRIETEEAIDLGERILLLNHDRADSVREARTRSEAVSALSLPSATQRWSASMHTTLAMRP
jgi:hypothetical protein